MYGMEYSREIELRGHIIDSGIMTKVFDAIMEMGGYFEILVFEIGKKKQDESFARLLVSAEDETQLAEIMSVLHRLGARGGVATGRGNRDGLSDSCCPV